jgi:deoxyadenosine/deoxycytidine kinase
MGKQTKSIKSKSVQVKKAVKVSNKAVLPYYDEEFGENLNADMKRGKLLMFLVSNIDKIKKQKSGISVNIGKVTGNENEHLAKGLMRKYRNYFLKKDGCFKLPLMFKAVRNDSSNKNKILEFTVNTI